MQAPSNLQLPDGIEELASPAVVPGRLGSDTLTPVSGGAIRVLTQPVYLPEHSDPMTPQHIFGYKVRVVNQTDRAIRLIRRKWLIIDSHGRSEQVEGEGIVGKMPLLKPGAAHEYNSYCPLRTSWGTMEGEYGVADTEGNNFRVRIGRFYLAAPRDEHR